MSRPEVVARLERVEYGYPTRSGRRPVLAGVDLDLARGEMVALLGPNGSGKSTLLHLVAGTLTPAAGRVELFGRPIATWPRQEIARSVAVLPQELQLPPGFRVSEVVGLARLPHARSWFGSEPGDERAVADALRESDAEELADRPVQELSGGERQRVIVAMALAQEPRLLLLDEPTLHLDLAHQVALVELLARLRRTRELTILAVLHDLNLAERFADRAVLLAGGRLLPAGGHEAVVDPVAASRAFGLPIGEARAADGRRFLVPTSGRPPD